MLYNIYIIVIVEQIYVKKRRIADRNCVFVSSKKTGLLYS